jgi:hypothetical protein
MHNARLRNPRRTFQHLRLPRPQPYIKNDPGGFCHPDFVFALQEARSLPPSPGFGVASTVAVLKEPEACSLALAILKDPRG